MSIVHLYVSFKNFFAFLRFILEGDAIIFTCPGLKTWWEHHHSRNLQKELMLLQPIGSMYAINGNIYHQYTPNDSIYTIYDTWILWDMAW
jgi:hypothetical protein